MKCDHRIFFSFISDLSCSGIVSNFQLSPGDFSEHLPSRLDIGDVSECKVTEGSSMNQKIIFSGEVCGSTAGPSGSSF